MDRARAATEPGTDGGFGQRALVGFSGPGTNPNYKGALLLGATSQPAAAPILISLGRFLLVGGPGQSATHPPTRGRLYCGLQRISSSWGWRLGHLAVGPFACPLAHAMRERGGAMGRSETRAPLALIPSCDCRVRLHAGARERQGSTEVSRRTRAAARASCFF